MVYMVLAFAAIAHVKKTYTFAWQRLPSICLGRARSKNNQTIGTHAATPKQTVKKSQHMKDQEHCLAMRVSAPACARPRTQLLGDVCGRGLEFVGAPKSQPENISF